MLERCLQYYGLEAHASISLSLYKLAEHSESLYPCGYKDADNELQKKSYSELSTLFSLPQREESKELINEIVRYASMFGIITNVFITPSYIEWSYNPYHKRDLFFTELRFTCREALVSFF